jgi:phosphate/sulfate permease
MIITTVTRYIQIFTAVCASFAHGANDIANAMGPFMTVYGVYHAGKVSKSSDVSDDRYVSHRFFPRHSCTHRHHQCHRCYYDICTTTFIRLSGCY